MNDLERLCITLQYRINEARNKGSKVTTIFTSTLSECMTLMKEQNTILKRLRDTMEDMEHENASMEVSYLLRLMDKWERLVK